MKPFWIAIRPKTLIASISPVAIGTSMAIADGAFNFYVMLLTLLCAMGIQISCNVANDLFDYLKGADTPMRQGPKRVTASGLMTVFQVKLLTIKMMGLTAICGGCLAYHGGLFIALLVCIALILALAYTCGPFPISYLGLGEFFVLVFFGPVATGFTYYLQTLTFSKAPFWMGLSPGLISCGILIVNHLRDCDQDRNAKKKTLVVRFGTNFGKWEYSYAVLLAPLIPLFMLPSHPWLLICAFCLIPSIKLFRLVFAAQQEQNYTPLFAKTGQLLTLYTTAFSLGMLL